jgi:hypothetical protein
VYFLPLGELAAVKVSMLPNAQRQIRTGLRLGMTAIAGLRPLPLTGMGI